MRPLPWGLLALGINRPDRNQIAGFAIRAASIQRSACSRRHLAPLIDAVGEASECIAEEVVYFFLAASQLAPSTTTLSY